MGRDANDTRANRYKSRNIADETGYGEPATTPNSTGNTLAAALANLQRLGISEYDANLGRMTTSTPVSHKTAMDQYKAALNADRQNSLLQQANETASQMSNDGLQSASQTPYGASVALNDDGNGFNINDAAGNKLTSGQIGTGVGALQNTLQKFDIDPSSLLSALQGYSVSNPQLMKDAQQAVNSYQRNPLVGYGEQLSNPASSMQNADGTYQHAMGKQYDSYNGPENNEAALRASQSWTRTNPDWQKIQTGWLNHGNLNEGRSDLVNNGIDTSGVKFQFGGNARGGVNTGNGFANTGYEAGNSPSYQPQPQASNTMQGFGNLFAQPEQPTTPAAPTPPPQTSQLGDYGWMNKYNQNSVLPATYQPGAKSPTNGDWGSWATNNPFKIQGF